MEQNLHTPEVYDFRQYDRLWKRVAPGLEPYPPTGERPAGDLSAVQPPEDGRELMAAAGISALPAAAPVVSVPSDAGEGSSSGLLRQESQLPGADRDPCCMGTAAKEMLEVLTGFAEEELEDQRQLQNLARQGPTWARGRLRELAAAEGEHARRLMAVYYLITGQCYRPRLSLDRIGPLRWCEALRERYHAAACNGMNYIRAAEGSTDPCLRRLLEEFSDDEYRQADVLLAMLERSLRP